MAALSDSPVLSQHPAESSQVIFVELKKKKIWSSHRGSEEMNLTSIHEDVSLIPDLTQWVKDLAGVAVAMV